MDLPYCICRRRPVRATARISPCRRCTVSCWLCRPEVQSSPDATQQSANVEALRGGFVNVEACKRGGFCKSIKLHESCRYYVLPLHSAWSTVETKLRHVSRTAERALIHSPIKFTASLPVPTFSLCLAITISLTTVWLCSVIFQVPSQ